MTHMPILRPGRKVLTIPRMLERSAGLHGGRLALHMRRNGRWQRHTYGELLAQVRRLAAGLTKLGLGPGDRVGLVGDNGPEWVMGYFAIAWAGGIILPLDARLTPGERAHILRHSGASSLIASERFFAESVDLGKDIPHLKVISMNLHADGQHPSYASLLAGEPEGLAESIPRLDDPAVILYTSGTTGSSKGVTLTHGNLMSNVEAIYQVIDFGSGDNFFSVLPLHHVFEATVGMLTPLSSGASITFSRSLKPNEIREDLSATQATVLIAVPLLLEKVVQGIEREVRRSPLVRRALFYGLKGTARTLDRFAGGSAAKTLMKKIRQKTGFASLRYIVSGGAALPIWAKDGLEELGFSLLQGYGLSESSPVLTCNPPARPKNSSVGLPLPGVEIRIDGPPGEPGEIIAQGPGIMVGYYRNEEETALALDAGWLRTGDIGYLDSEGYLYITGRKKSVIITPGGKNIYPEEVEAVLLAASFIEEALVVRGRNPRTGVEEVEAIIYPNFQEIDRHFEEKGPGRPTKEDVARLIGDQVKERSEMLADYKRPKRFSIREEEFPKTTTKKIKRYLFEQETIEIPGAGRSDQA